MLKIDIVKFDPCGDGVTAVYIDGSLYAYGDYYHHKINDWINGFLDGLRYCNKAYEETNHSVDSTNNRELVEEVVEMGCTPPALLGDCFSGNST